MLLRSFLLSLLLEPGPSELYGPGGSDYAEENRAKLLAEMIPALTLAVGANETVIFNSNTSAPSRNFNLNDPLLFRIDWPEVRLSNGKKQSRWLYSDIRDISYLYNKSLFESLLKLETWMRKTMNKSKFLMVALISICSFGVSACGSQLPHARLTVNIVDEEGDSLAGVRVAAAGVPGGGPDSSVDSGFTGDDGRVTLTFRAFGTAEMSARRDGYYSSYQVPYQFGGATDTFDEAYRRGRWEPWNPEVIVELKKIRDPIPMYVQSVNLGIPEFGVPLGFDLMVSDWITPHGEGRVADLVIFATSDQRGERDFDYELRVSFSNPGDGIQSFDGLPPGRGSLLKSSHEAPERGYQPEWFQWRRRRPNQPEESNRDRNRNYYIRVRTELDEEGNVVRAHYGKIYGDFLQFTHYLNPEPNSRNIEYDGKTNLIPGARAQAAP